MHSSLQQNRFNVIFHN